MLNEIHESRSSAGQIVASYQNALARVRSDETLSPAGKSEAILSLYREAKSRLDGMREREPRVIQQRIAELERTLFGGASFSDTATISRRDAGDRADRVESDDDAVTMYRRARTDDDSALTRALLRRGIGAGWRALLNAHVAAEPLDGDRITELVELRELAEDAGAMFIAASHYAIGVPSEIAGMRV
jgi:hypothetical protein